MCPPTAIYVSSYYYVCVLRYAERRRAAAYCYTYYYIFVLLLLCVLILLYMCPRTAISVSSYCYICVLIRIYLLIHIYLRIPPHMCHQVWLDEACSLSVRGGGVTRWGGAGEGAPQGLQGPLAESVQGGVAKGIAGADELRRLYMMRFDAGLLKVRKSGGGGRQRESRGSIKALLRLWG